MEELHKRYFDWLYEIVCGQEEYNRLSYRKLLNFLYNTEFYYIIPLDENRACDGIGCRYRFGDESGYSKNTIERYLDDRPCSVLEMMVAMAIRVEEQIMDNYQYGNRTGQWFWSMIVSLGLGNMSDDNFNRSFAQNIILRFMDRMYEPNGKGGLFTIENSHYDLKYVEIWTQFMWYLNTIDDEY